MSRNVAERKESPEEHRTNSGNDIVKQFCHSKLNTQNITKNISVNVGLLSNNSCSYGELKRRRHLRQTRNSYGDKFHLAQCSHSDKQKHSNQFTNFPVPDGDKLYYVKNYLNDASQIETVEESDATRCHSVLRLRGGGLLEIEKLPPFRLRAGAPSKSPIAECQEVMEQFDKVLEEYRKALAPCGHIACNYTQNITEATCKTACGIKPEIGLNTTKGCGSPECEYAKYKKGLMAMDADIETQFIGPAIIGNCGHPRCPYHSEPILPPIHWECPEPLPTGKCKNPHCPYPPNDMGNQCRISSTKGPCGSNMCPFVPPAPCSSPNCPFKHSQSDSQCFECGVRTKNQSCSKTFPSAKEACKHDPANKRSNQQKNTSYAKCPFANPPTIVNLMQFCDNPNCEVLKKAPSGDCGTRATMCNSPNCPYIRIKNECSNPECPFVRSEASSECSNPDCPLRKRSSGSCSNPNCPFSKSESQTDSGSCENPNCPYKKSSTEPSSENYNDATCPQSNSTISSACLNPLCPFRKSSKESEKKPEKEACANPECPFNKPSVESCKNPDCPFKTKPSVESSESCDNPECPFKKGSKTSGRTEDSECECENPLCPGKKETCLNPNCPFNLRGYEPCTNPECPHRKYAYGKDLGYCATPDPSFNEFCADKTCLFHDPKVDKNGVIDMADPNGPKSLGKSMMQIGSVVIEQGEVEHTAGDRPSVYDMIPCNIKTCKFMGGNLTCVDCGVGTDGRRRGPCPKTCPGDPICALATARKTRKPPRRPEPIFKRTCRNIIAKKKLGKIESADKYPGYKIGHRECVMPYFFVPPKMGWLWNIHTPCLNLKPRRGWRPGAITRSVARAIMKHKKALSMNPHEEHKKRKRKDDDDDEQEMICPKPTLEIKKREGTYFITMNPLKDPNMLEMNENPYLDCTPMQFKVAKNNLLDPDCVCTDEGELYKSDSSSNSELDIEITTPAGIIHPDRPVQRKNFKYKLTQYDEKDIPLPPEKKKDKDKEGKSDVKPKKGKKGKK